jgi:hypothetical protein
MPAPPSPPTLDTEFLRTRPGALGGMPVVLSLRALRGRELVEPCWCSFCWCRNSRSRRAKHLAHWGHSNGFSFVCERSCRFKCSSLANDRVQVVQMCGRGLSVLGWGKGAAAVGDVAGFAVWLEAASMPWSVCDALLYEASTLTVAAACTCRVVTGNARSARQLRVFGLGGHGEFRSGATTILTPHSTMTLRGLGLECSTT